MCFVVMFRKYRVNIIILNTIIKVRMLFRIIVLNPYLISIVSSVSIECSILSNNQRLVKTLINRLIAPYRSSYLCGFSILIGFCLEYTLSAVNNLLTYPLVRSRCKQIYTIVTGGMQPVFSDLDPTHVTFRLLDRWSLRHPSMRSAFQLVNYM